MPADIGQLGVFAAQYVNRCKHGYTSRSLLFQAEVIL